MQSRLHITLEIGSRADIEISSIEHHLLDPYVLQYSTTVRKTFISLKNHKRSNVL